MKRAGLALIVLVVAAFGLGWWAIMPGRVGGERGSGLVESRSSSSSGAATLLPASGAALTTSAESSGSAAAGRETALDSTPRAPVRGQLVGVEDGMPVEEARYVLLSSEGDRVSEALFTDAHGAFTTTRAFPRGELRIWVRGPDKTRHAAPSDPEVPGPWTVPVPRPEPVAFLEEQEEEPPENLVLGRVVDRAGRPVTGASVSLARVLGGRERRETDALGEFTLATAASGDHFLSVEHNFARSVPLTVRVGGVQSLGDIELPIDDIGCSLEGRIVVGRMCTLRILELASGRSIDVDPRWPDEERGFEVTGLAAGRYRLTLLSPVHSFEPETMEVVAPARGIEIGTRAESGPARIYHFEVRDLETGVSIRGASFLARLDGAWESFQAEIPHGFERWIVMASGYIPAEGPFSGEFFEAGETPGQATSTLTVRLRRGYGTVHYALEAEAWDDHRLRPLAGVRARRGELLGRPSGEDGLVWEELESALRLDFELPGWRLRESEWFGGLEALLFEPR